MTITFYLVPQHPVENTALFLNDHKQGFYLPLPLSGLGTVLVNGLFVLQPTAMFCRSPPILKFKAVTLPVSGFGYGL